MSDTHQAIDLNVNFKVTGDIRAESEEGEGLKMIQRDIRMSE